jgi:hypothetical protein
MEVEAQLHNLIEAQLHNFIEAPNKYHEAFTWRKLQGDLFCTKARSTKRGKVRASLPNSKVLRDLVG